MKKRYKIYYSDENNVKHYLYSLAGASENKTNLSFIEDKEMSLTFKSKVVAKEIKKFCAKAMIENIFKLEIIFI